MRLTLRTLLAWLDDTLSPAEVREIGKQVAESPFAKELVERVHRVTRQRRLTVPGRTGPDSTDPNVVASYLDNELPPEEVAEFEKRCLTSDVHLAEVASVHQVLSLIGQKAKVPTEARHRMYHLIKGRESVAPRAPRASMAEEPDPVSEPIQPWVLHEPPRQNWYTQILPAAAVSLLVGLFCWSAWMSLAPAETPSGESGQPEAPVVAQKPVPKKNEVEANKPPVEPTEVAVVTKPDESETKEEVSPETVKTEMEKTASPTELASTTDTSDQALAGLPAGSLGKADKTEGILLRFNPEDREWLQLTEETPLKGEDRLLNLAQLRSTLHLGTSKAVLVGETEVKVLPTAAGEAGRLEVIQGRLVLSDLPHDAPFVIEVGKQKVSLTLKSTASVGVERVNHREPGARIPAEPTLVVYSTDGDVLLEAEGGNEELSGSGSILFDGHGAWAKPTKAAPPNWVVDLTPSPYDQQVGDQFKRYFRPGLGSLRNLVEALEDEQKDVRRLAISATKSAGGISMIVPLLHQEENPVSRRAAISVLRANLAENAEAMGAVHTELESFFGPELAPRVEKLLVGFTPKEVAEEATYKDLVSDLASPEVAIRELGLESLQTLTGRDDLGFDPDHPNGKGLTTWRNLMNSHELRPVSVPGSEEGDQNRETPAAKTETP